jgi:acetyl-CoA carboxylase biotin carboxyl carrier protein
MTAGRLHAPAVEAIVARAASDAPSVPPAPGSEAELIELRAPMPGVFVPAIAAGDLVAPGGRLGELVVLGRAVAVVVPRTAASGIAVRIAATAARAVGYGEPLVVLDPALQRGPGTAAPATADPPSVHGLVFRAPTSGRFYGRSSPDKPPFVTPGAELAQGATICLLEVMKTFHRVTYGGPGLPEIARVTRVLVADGDDVNAGDPLLALA